MKFTIQNVDTGLVIEIKDGKEEAYGEIVMAPYHPGSKRQIWKYKNGMIYSKLNKLVLDVEAHEGPRVITFQAHGGDNQLWYFDDDGTIRSGNGKVLDVQGASRDDGATVIAWSKHGDSNQIFRRVEI